MAIAFIDCTSVTINFDIYGFAHVSYVVYSDDPELKVIQPVAGMSGYVTSASVMPMPNTSRWYINNITIIAMNVT